MKRDNYDAWLKALRSGEYTQGRGHLRKDGCFCAIGVLAETGTFARPGEYFFRGEGTYAELGLHASEGQIIVYLNDKKRKSFSEIAGWIEENIEPEEDDA